MKKIIIEEVQDGYVVSVADGAKVSLYVRKATEEFNLLEFIGKTLLGYLIKVERK